MIPWLCKAQSPFSTSRMKFTVVTGLNVSKFFRMDIVVVSIIIIGVIGVTMDLVMRFLERRLIPWRGSG